MVASFSREAGQILSAAPFVLPLRKPVRMLPRSGEPYLLPNRPLHALRLRTTKCHHSAPSFNLFQRFLRRMKAEDQAVCMACNKNRKFETEYGPFQCLVHNFTSYYSYKV